jgi:hypothetical protein
VVHLAISEQSVTVCQLLRTAVPSQDSTS